MTTHYISGKPICRRYQTGACAVKQSHLAKKHPSLEGPEPDPRPRPGQDTTCQEPPRPRAGASSPPYPALRGSSLRRYSESAVSPLLYNSLRFSSFSPEAATLALPIRSLGVPLFSLRPPLPCPCAAAIRCRGVQAPCCLHNPPCTIKPRIGHPALGPGQSGRAPLYRQAWAMHRSQCTGQCHGGERSSYSGMLGSLLFGANAHLLGREIYVEEEMLQR